MFQISQDFAPPFKLIAPFFILGTLFYLLSTLLLFAFTQEEISYLHPYVLSFAHIFLLGFVMMSIFGAMAQLVPVILEVGHFGVELFYAIWPLLLIGTLLMAFGFVYAPALLPYGGIFVFISMLIFIGEIFLTLKRVKKFNIVMSSVLLSNTFLFIGVVIGLIMALGYAGVLEVEIFPLLKAHVYLVVGGYICITIMGLSIVLLPMFGLSHGYSLKALEVSLYLMSFGVVFVLLASLNGGLVVEYFAYALSFSSLVSFFYQIILIYKTRARLERDIYARSLLFAFFSLTLALLLGSIYLVNSYEPLLLGSVWLLFFGFFGFIITGHMYKIIPFLVWFERFSPLVGKEKVPMLADMLPKRSAEAQFVFSSVGVVIICIALVTQESSLIGAGASFLVVGALAFMRSVLYMINFK